MLSFVISIALICGAVSSPHSQQPRSTRTLAITYAGYGPEHLEGWQHSAKTSGYELVWHATPLFLDRQADNEWRAHTPVAYVPGHPVVVDFDKDGENELLMVDTFGITLYGKSPAYYPFPIATYGVVQLLVADVDEDGRNELATHRGSVSGGSRELEVWRLTDSGLRSVGKQTLHPELLSYVLICGDADNDGKNEIISATGTIQILKRGVETGWELAAELPNIGTLVDVVRVADVDGDGMNEVVAAGNSGKLTIYKHVRNARSGKESYTVLWQSPYLLSPESSPKAKAVPAEPPLCFTQGLAVGDVNGDGEPEILVGTSQDGAGRIHIFKFDKRRDFESVWVSDWTKGASIPAFALGDLDGDGLIEFVYNGIEVYKYDAAGKTYRRQAGLCSDCSGSVIGRLGEMREPVSAIRIVPVRWTLPAILVRGQTVEGRITLRSVWAEAKDVTVTVKSEDPLVTVNNAILRLPSIPGGRDVDTPPFTLSIAQDSGMGQTNYLPARLSLQITAAGGYNQTVQILRYTERPK
jgi:hypothetical protein